MGENLGPKPLVSIVVPVLNGERHIAACIDSILNQSYGNFEVIVADNASTDRTAEIVESFNDARIRILSEVDEQLSLHANWSRAVRAGTGQYLKIVPHDDLIYRPCLEAQVQLLEEHPTAVLTACRRRIIDDNGGVVVRSRGLGNLLPRGGTRLIEAPDLARACTRAGTNLLGEPACALIRRTALPDPLFDPRWSYALDVEFYLRCVKGRSAVLDSRTLCDFRVSPHQLSASLGARQASEMRAFLRQMPKNYPGRVTDGDVRLGAVRSQLIVQARRALYQYLRIRESISAGRR